METIMVAEGAMGVIRATGVMGVLDMMVIMEVLIMVAKDSFLMVVDMEGIHIKERFLMAVITTMDGEISDTKDTKAMNTKLKL